MVGNKLETVDYIDLSKDWYYVQGFRPKGGERIIVVFAKTKKEAMEKIQPWMKYHGITDNITLYRNNYKPEARKLVRAGKVIK